MQTVIYTVNDPTSGYLADVSYKGDQEVGPATDQTGYDQQARRPSAPYARGEQSVYQPIRDASGNSKTQVKNNAKARGYDKQADQNLAELSLEKEIIVDAVNEEVPLQDIENFVDLKIAQLEPEPSPTEVSSRLTLPPVGQSLEQIQDRSSTSDPKGQVWTTAPLYTAQPQYFQGDLDSLPSTQGC